MSIPAALRAACRTIARRAALVALASLAVLPGNAAAQDRFRVGLSFGGTGFVGVVGERVWGDRSLELLVSTFAFRDVSVSVVGKQAFGASWLKPTVGAGLWMMTGESEDGRGTAVLARFPLGADWKVSGPSHLTLEVNAARGLWVRRPDPADDFPISQRLIPIPGLSYRAGFGG